MKPLESAQKILTVFFLDLKVAGDELPVARFADGCTDLERKKGIKFAVGEGWIESMQNAHFRLTAVGFEQLMKKDN